MNIEAKKYYDENKSIFSMAQSYKGLEIYPLKIRDFRMQELFYSLLTYPQASLSKEHPEIFKMSYLKFVIYVLQIITDKDKKSKPIIEKLQEFMNFITKRHDIIFSVVNDGAELEDLIIVMKFGNKTFTESDFQNIREIILEANGTSIDYVEEYNSDLEKDLEFLHKKSEKYNFKDQTFSLAAILSKSIREISQYTLFEMKNLLESASALQSFRMQSIPLTEVGKEYDYQPMIKHLVPKGRYDDVLEDTDKFKEETSYFKTDKQLTKQ